MCINVLYVLVPVLVRVLLDGSGHDSAEIDGTLERHATSTPSKQPVPAPRHSSKLSTKTDLHLQFEDNESTKIPKSPKTRIPEPSSKLPQKTPDKVSSKSPKKTPEKSSSPIKDEVCTKILKEPQSPKSKIPVKVKETTKDGEKTIVKEFVTDEGVTTVTETVKTKFDKDILQDNKYSSEGKTVTERYTTLKTTTSNVVDSSLTKGDKTTKMITTVKSSSGESIDPEKFKEKFQDVSELWPTSTSEQFDEVQEDGTIMRTTITRNTHSGDIVDSSRLPEFLKDGESVKTVTTVRTSSGKEIDPETVKDFAKDGTHSKKTVRTITRTITSSGESEDVSGYTTSSTGIIDPAEFDKILKSQSGKELSLENFDNVSNLESFTTETGERIDPELYKQLLKDGKGVMKTVTTVKSSTGEPIDLQKLDFKDGKVTKTVTVKSSTGETIDQEKFKEFFKDGNVTSVKKIKETIRTVKSGSSEPETWTETVVTKRSSDGKPESWQTVTHSGNTRSEEWDTEFQLDTSPSSGNGDFYSKNGGSRREMNSETDSDSSPQPRRRSPSKRRTLGSSSGSDVALHEGAELSPLEDDQGTSLTANILSKQCTYPATNKRNIKTSRSTTLIHCYWDSICCVYHIIIIENIRVNGSSIYRYLKKISSVTSYI